MTRTVLLSATVVLALLVACMAALVAASVKPADAAFPAENGAIAFVRGSEGTTEQIWRMRPDGTRQRMLYERPLFTTPDENSTIVNPIRMESDPAWSPDGTKIAFTQEVVKGDDYDETYNDLFLMDPDGSNLVNLTNDGIYDHGPSWYPSGDRLAITCGATGQPPIQTDICSMSFDAAAGSVVRTKLTRLPTESEPNWIDDYVAAVSPDGKRIAFVRRSNVAGDRDDEIYVMDADRPEWPDNAAVKLTDNDAYDSRPDWSPDGSKIVYESSSNGNPDIFVMNARDGSGKKNLTKGSAAGERAAVFSPDGRFIVFVSNRDGDDEIWRMRRDGSRKVQLTKNTAYDSSPDWQPLP
jgi:TolB protein